MASLLLALHPAAFFAPGGSLRAPTRISAPTMADVDVQTQIEQLQAKLEIMRLKSQLEELQRQAAPAPAVPDVVVSAPSALAQAEPLASAAAAVVQARPPAPPVVSAWSTFFPVPTQEEVAAFDPLQDAIRQQAADAAAASAAASAASASMSSSTRLPSPSASGDKGSSSGTPFARQAVTAYLPPTGVGKGAGGGGRWR